MARTLKTVPAIVAAAGIMAGAFADGSVPMQTTQDRTEGNRLIVDGKPLFASGMNIAWISAGSFGNDVGDMPIDAFAFRQHVQNVRKAGGNALRWWLHTDASNCPKITDDGVVTGIGSETVSNINKALDIAHENGVALILCLFSFDLLVPGDGGKGSSFYPNYTLDGNYKLLTVPGNIDTYINNALIPILNGVGNHPAIMAWEVYNEPEGMLAKENWSHVARKITFDDILRTTNKIAGAIRRNSKKMVSTGIKDFSYLWNHSSNSNTFRYSGAALIAAGGDTDGWLDFYMGHYYPEWQGTSISPFHNSASHWAADRPIVIAEFPSRSWPWSGYNVQPGTDMDIVEAYRYAFGNGYAGALSWALTDPAFGTIEHMTPALQYLYNNHKNDIMIKEVEIEDLTGDLAMSLTFNNLPLPAGDRPMISIDRNPALNLASSTNITFEMYVPEGSPTNFEFRLALQDNNWGWAQASVVQLANVNQGEWVTVTVPVASVNEIYSSNNSFNYAQTGRIIIQYAPVGAPYTGTLYFDNFKVDNLVIADFDDGNAWNVSGGGAAGIVKRASVGGGASVRNGVGPGVSARAPHVTVTGRTLNVKSPADVDVQLRLVNMRGRTVARFNAAGSGRFSIADVPAGRYIVEARVAGKRVGSTPVIVK